MAVLSHSLLTLTLLATASCYAPDLRDCTVTCGGSDECAGDQVCNSGGRCAADGVTCMGSGGATVDGGADGPPTFALRVQVEGKGKVVVEGVGECSESQQPCTWMVSARILRFTAQQTDSNKPFERWTTMNCTPAPQPSCTFAATASTTVGAKFK